MSERISGSRTALACDAGVVGAGPAGIAAALALAHVGAEVALIGPPPAKLWERMSPVA